MGHHGEVQVVQGQVGVLQEHLRAAMNHRLAVQVIQEAVTDLCGEAPAQNQGHPRAKAQYHLDHHQVDRVVMDLLPVLTDLRVLQGQDQTQDLA